MSKRELLKAQKIVNEKAAIWFSLVKTLSAELYTLNPNHRIFKENLFSDATLKLIKEDSMKYVKGSPYSKIVYHGRDLSIETINLDELRKEIKE